MARAVIILFLLFIASLVITEKSHVANVSVENGSVTGNKSVLMELRKGKYKVMDFLK